MAGNGAGFLEGARSYLPVSIVCFPPERTPKGSVPVGVRPLRVSTLSLSSLQRNMEALVNAREPQHSRAVTSEGE